MDLIKAHLSSESNIRKVFYGDVLDGDYCLEIVEHHSENYPIFSAQLEIMSFSNGRFTVTKLEGFAKAFNSASKQSYENNPSEVFELRCCRPKRLS